MEGSTSVQVPPGDLPSQVSERLFVGSVGNARDPALLDRLGITHLVNAAQEFRHPWQGQDCYLHAPLFDSTSERVAPFFEQVWLFTEKALGDGASVMIFCQHGISRSVTLALSYMMQSERLTLGGAFTKLRAARAEAEPNPGFLWELRQLEAKLYGRVTTTELLTRFDRGAELAEYRETNSFLGSMADFVAGGDGRISETVSQASLDRVLNAAQELGPDLFGEAILPVVCETFTHFGGRSNRDEGARDFLRRALYAVANSAPAYADALSKRLEDIQDEDEFQSIVEDVPLAPKFLESLRRKKIG